MKKIFKILLIALITIGCTSCFKTDSMENINIITTIYPIEYVLTNLYGENSIINSIYPDGVNINEYKLSEKEYNDFIKKDLFVYNGLGKDRDIAKNLLNRNKDLLIMDASFGMEYEYGIEELWLNPSNLLMMSQNIKNGLFEFIESSIIKEKIKKNYDSLKVSLSELDASIKLLNEQASNKTLIVASPALQFLTKYGFNIIYVSDAPNNTKDVVNATKLINDGTIKYIYILEGDEESKALSQIKKDTKVEIIEFRKIDNLTDEERDNKKDYISLMESNIELLRKGIK